MDLEELRAFLNVVDAGSFLAAADSLGVSRTTLRRRIEGLEARAGVQLIKNTPRGIIVTDAGQVLAKRGRVMVQDVGVLVSSLRKIGGQPEGVLNVVMPVGLPPHLLTPLFAALRAAYPALRVSCRISDDPLQEPLEDVDIAVHFGDEEPPSPWLSYVIMRVRRWLVASTEYLARRGTPKDIEQLRMHELLAWRAPRTDGSIWPLVSGSTFRVEPALVATDVHLVRSCAIAGQGIALVPDAVLPDPGVAEGSMVGVLRDVVGADISLRVTVPEMLSETPKVKMILDHISAFLDPIRR